MKNLVGHGCSPGDSMRRMSRVGMKESSYESKTSIYCPNDGQRLHRRTTSVGWQTIYQSSSSQSMGLFFGRMGNEGGYVIGLFLILCLGAAVVVAVAWVFVQILLWMEE